LDDRKKFFLGIIVLSITGVFTGWSKQNFTLVYFKGKVSEDFASLFSYMDWFFGFLAPFLIYTFLSISTFLMARILEERITIKSLYVNVGLAFLPQLIVTIFVTYVLSFLTAQDIGDIVKTGDLTNPVHWGLSLKDLRIFIWIGYAFLYLHILLYLIKVEGFSTINAVLAIFIPTLIITFIYMFL